MFTSCYVIYTVVKTIHSLWTDDKQGSMIMNDGWSLSSSSSATLLNKRKLLLVAPKWTTIRNELKWTWLLHTYGFACVFFMLAFYAFFSILNLRAQLATRPYMSSINVFLCLLGVSRATCFLVDPYDSKGILPEAIGSITWDLAIPCLISSFSLIQLAFLQLTQLKLGPTKMRSKSFVSLVISSHFFFIIASDIIRTFQEKSKIACYVCQTIYLCWGILLSVTFLYGGWKMMKLLRHAPPSLFQQTDPCGFEKKVQALGMLANCHNLAAMTAAAAAAVPSFLATPKIKITDENEQSYSYVSDNSHLSTNSTQQLYNETAPSDTTNSNDLQSKRSPQKTQTKCVYTVANDKDSSKVSKPLMSPDHSPIKISAVNGIHHKNLIPPPSNCPNANKSKNKKKSKMGNVRWNELDQDDQLEMSLIPKCRSNGSATKVKSERVQRMNGGSEDEKEDLTLISILNHIAYVNQAANGYKSDYRKMRLSKKSQVEKVLQGTCAAASLGLVLCLLELYRIYGQYGLLASYTEPEPWSWFIFQTTCRFVEFSMGCFVANITKQPVNRHHYPYASAHVKHRSSGLYFY
ncbi:hypothetical protein CHUAL_008882 [Chamberlinius hualienensis]